MAVSSNPHFCTYNIFFVGICLNFCPDCCTFSIQSILRHKNFFKLRRISYIKRILYAVACFAFSIHSRKAYSMITFAECCIHFIRKFTCRFVIIIRKICLCYQRFSVQIHRYRRDSADVCDICCNYRIFCRSSYNINICNRWCSAIIDQDILAGLIYRCGYLLRIFIHFTVHINIDIIFFIETINSKIRNVRKSCSCILKFFLCIAESDFQICTGKISYFFVFIFVGN